jgi:hypothetical protein
MDSLDFLDEILGSDSKPNPSLKSKLVTEKNIQPSLKSIQGRDSDIKSKSHVKPRMESNSSTDMKQAVNPKLPIHSKSNFDHKAKIDHESPKMKSVKPISNILIHRDIEIVSKAHRQTGQKEKKSVSSHSSKPAQPMAPHDHHHITNDSKPKSYSNHRNNLNKLIDSTKTDSTSSVHSRSGDWDSGGKLAAVYPSLPHELIKPSLHQNKMIGSGVFGSLSPSIPNI